MSLSRQERRRIAREAQKRAAFEQRYGDQIIERQNKIDDRTVEIYTTCMALAITDLYGYMPKRVNRIVTRFCERIYQVEEDGVGFPELAQELKDKTGIEFVWKR